MTVSDFTSQTAPTLVTTPPPEVLREIAAYSARAQMAKGVPVDYTTLLPVNAPPAPATAPVVPKIKARANRSPAAPRARIRSRKRVRRVEDPSTRGAIRAAQCVLWLQAASCFLTGVALPFTGLLSPKLSLSLLVPLLGTGMLYAALALGVRKRSHLAIVVASVLNGLGLVAAVPLAFHGAWPTTALVAVFLFVMVWAERSLVQFRARCR